MTSQCFDKNQAAALCEQSRCSPRRRAHHSLHSADSDVVHRLYVAMQPDSYVPPHRHLDPNKDESLIVLSGLLGFLAFSDTGDVIAQSTLGPEGSGWGVDIPSGCWHAVVALKADTLFFETKAGPYRPMTEDELAPWATAEGTPQATETLARLASLFKV